MSILVGDRVHSARDTLDLIDRCVGGDEAALEQLYRTYAGDVYRLVYGLLGHREDAEEVVQDTFIYAMRNLARYKAERASFRTWLFIIAVSRARNKRRRRLLPTVSLRRLIGSEAGPHLSNQSDRPPEAALVGAGLRETVRAAVNQLSPKLREAVALRYSEGLTYKEIGQILGISHKTAESRVRLAHRALRGLIEQPD
jgi:RNA polymerase sigma-70 factor (ECF subfamily)